MGTHLNCINKSMQIQMRTHNICLYKKVNKKYTGCNLKTTEFHECALIGVCGVIRSNTVYCDYSLEEPPNNKKNIILIHSFHPEP